MCQKFLRCSGGFSPNPTYHKREPERLASEAAPLVDQADIERQKVVVADLINLSADELNNLNSFNLAECDKMIKELMDFIANPTKDALITDVLCQITLLHQQRSQLKAKRFLQLHVEHQMILDRVSAARRELSKTEVSMEEADAETKDLKAPDVSEAASHQRRESSTLHVISSHDQPQQVESLQELESQNSSAVPNAAPRTEPVLPKFRAEPLNFEFTGSISTDSMGDAGSQTVLDEALLHLAAVDSPKEYQVNNSVDTGGSDWRDEQTSHLTHTTTCPDSVPPPKGQKSYTGGPHEPKTPLHVRVHTSENSQLDQEHSSLHQKLVHRPPSGHEHNQFDFPGGPGFSGCSFYFCY
ncbi:uncharacterized protein LOC105940211 [Fundulus heteroclitus]|uniref:uncharacterized protein LOC105940211 n=1 Tax=Fundulus heteroclitus TaxID=8078 RepID=UPI00165C0BEF|nr:uncharacterized protein LOC105940211 [Fundulus heteroclitus]XP_036006058.1 uncharacterized protein LOC105940211 [Fundulus heteroclitus]